MEGRGAGLSQGGQEQRPSTTQRMTDGKKFLEDLQNVSEEYVIIYSVGAYLQPSTFMHMLSPVKTSVLCCVVVLDIHVSNAAGRAL